MATETALAMAKVESRKVRADGTLVYQHQRYGPLGDELAGETVQIRAPPQLSLIHI